MDNPAASALKKLISLIPEKAVRFTYLKFFKPKPLRVIADAAIKLLTPGRISIPEGVVNLNKDDPAVSGALALGAHDPYEIECFRDNIKPGMNVVDIGANIGYYTVIAAGRIGSRGKVFAYEPEESNFTLLKKNIDDNRFGWATLIKAGLSDQMGNRSLFLAEGHTGIHSFANNRSSSNSVEIETDTLDHSLEKYGSPKIDVIKMDIEGAEILAIQGMKKTLVANPKIAIFTEFYPQAIGRFGKQPIELLHAFRDLGFHLWTIDENSKQVLPLPENKFAEFVQSFPPQGEVARNIYASRYPN